MYWLTIISTLVLALVAIYFLLVLMALWGLLRLKPGWNQKLYSVSVVVAAKDESGTIAECLEALLAQDYPAERYQVVVVDDGSVDDTAAKVRGFCARDPRVRLVSAPPGSGPLRGKKRALDAGIAHSTGEIILVSDADCRPAPAWISTMVRHFEPGVGLVAGQVRQKGSKLWHKLRSLERLSLSAVAAGAIGWGLGLTATGGSLGYRREVFDHVGGFRRLARPLSGDDDLFVQLVSRRTRWQLRYAFQPEAAVDTDPPATLREFVAQERRRTSKGRHYSLGAQALAALAFLTNLSLAVALPLSLIRPELGPWPWAAWGAKVLGEFLLLSKAGRMLGQRGWWPYFPMAAVLYIPYFLLFAVWGTLGGYRWKAAAGAAAGKVDATRP